MKRVNLWLKYLDWHKQFHCHPLNDPKFARENLLSLFETISLFSLYFLTLMFALKLIVELGYIQSESLLTLIVNIFLPNKLFEITSYFNYDQEVAIGLVLTISAIMLTKLFFEISKSIVHHGMNKNNAVLFPKTQITK